MGFIQASDLFLEQQQTTIQDLSLSPEGVPAVSPMEQCTICCYLLERPTPHRTNGQQGSHVPPPTAAPCTSGLVRRWSARWLDISPYQTAAPLLSQSSAQICFAGSTSVNIIMLTDVKIMIFLPHIEDFWRRQCYGARKIFIVVRVRITSLQLLLSAPMALTRPEHTRPLSTAAANLQFSSAQTHTPVSCP